MSRVLIRQQVLDFEPYSPGLSIEEIKERYGLSSVLKLASNESPLGASPKALQALEKRLTEVPRERYSIMSLSGGNAARAIKKQKRIQYGCNKTGLL